MAAVKPYHQAKVVGLWIDDPGEQPVVTLKKFYSTTGFHEVQFDLLPEEVRYYALRLGKDVKLDAR